MVIFFSSVSFQVGQPVAYAELHTVGFREVMGLDVISDEQPVVGCRDAVSDADGLIAAAVGRVGGMSHVSVEIHADRRTHDGSRLPGRAANSHSLRSR